MNINNENQQNTEPYFTLNKQKYQRKQLISKKKTSILLISGIFMITALIIAFIGSQQNSNFKHRAQEQYQDVSPSQQTHRKSNIKSLQIYTNDGNSSKQNKRYLFEKQTDPIQIEKIKKKLKERKKPVFEEQDSERYMEYSKANQRKADKKRREQRIRKEMQDNNILKDIKKNPYLDDEYSYLTKEDVKRVKKWRYMVGQDFSRPSVLAEDQKKYYNDKYQVDKYEELPFCIIVPTFNNKPRKRAQRNLRSILMQDYKNFRLVIIDDGSADGTGMMLADMLKKQNSMNSSRYEVIIHKEKRYFSVANIRNASKNFCTERDIVIIVDGDDQLLGRQVLKLFNSVFQSKGVWYMYTNFLGSIGKVGYSRPYHPSIIEGNLYRQYSFAVSHLRAYYNKLLLNIKDEDLQDENGKFFTSAGDMAIAIPCMQQAHTRVMYVPEMTYYYNFNTGLNVHKKRLNEQRQNNLKIRAKKPYAPLDKLF